MVALAAQLIAASTKGSNQIRGVSTPADKVGVHWDLLLSIYIYFQNSDSDVWPSYFLILLLLLPLPLLTLLLLPLMFPLPLLALLPFPRRFPLFLLMLLATLVFLDSPRGNVASMTSMASMASMATWGIMATLLRHVEHCMHHTLGPPLKDKGRHNNIHALRNFYGF